MDKPVPDKTLAQINTLLFRGADLEAIRLYRDELGVGLKEARNAVRQIETELRRQSPEKFTAPPRKVFIAAGLLSCGLLAGMSWEFFGGPGPMKTIMATLAFLCATVQLALWWIYRPRKKKGDFSPTN
jgi:hypothetical protein